MLKKPFVAGIPAIGIAPAITFVVILLTSACSSPPERSVDPFIGTDADGRTFPGATVPFGMIQLSPSNDYQKGHRFSGYHYQDKIIKGFAHTHLSGANGAALGDILLMPTVGEVDVRHGTDEDVMKSYRSEFRHRTERAAEGYYKVALDRYDIDVELTATERVGLHRYTFPDTTQANIIIDPTHHINEEVLETRINLVSNQEIRGFKYSKGRSGRRYVFFVATFSEPFSRSDILIRDSIPALTSDESGKNVKAFVTFDAKKSRPIEVKVALSFVSYRGALKNLEAEAEAKTFDEVREEARQKWANVLDQIEVESSDKARKLFYTSLYRASMGPNVFSDVDGRYRIEGKVFRSKNQLQYTNYSTWNTFRALHPLFNLTMPQRNADIVNSMVSRYSQAKVGLPNYEISGSQSNARVGDNAVPIIADAIIKDLPGIDQKNALKAMIHAANNDRRSRTIYGYNGLNYYTTIGYVPAQFNYSVSKAMEYAYHDWCIYKAASKMGKDRVANEFWQRSKTFVNYFNENKAYFWPKTVEGKWVDIEMADWEKLFEHYISGNIWGYSAFMPHAIKNLEYLLGGREDFIAWLDDIFQVRPDDEAGYIGRYGHGHGPSLQMPYLYVFAAQPWKTQSLVRQIMNDFYDDSPAGLISSDDYGQLSAWYVFNSLGFYPVCPGDNKYIFGSPSVKKAVLHLADSVQFVILAENNSNQNRFVQSVSLNGEILNRAYLYHDEILAGGELIFEMGPSPNTTWATDEALLPDAKAADKHHNEKGPLNFSTLPPYERLGKTIFFGKQHIQLQSQTPDSDIRYNLSGKRPTRKDTEYQKPIEIDRTTVLKAVAYSDSLPRSPIYRKQYFHSVTARKRTPIRVLENINAPAYGAERSVRQLFDLQLAEKYAADIAWMGWEGNDLDVLLDLRKKEKIKSVTFRYLVDTDEAIFPPRSVTIKGSIDQENFVRLGSRFDKQPKGDMDREIRTVTVTIKPRQSRYLHIVIKNAGDLPAWHSDRGNPAKLFIDEVMIDVYQ